MGAYLSEPVRDKEVEEHKSHNLTCAAATMQGWRILQEDAHNCIINFDTNSSFFAVYDGHGGAEVAKYCAQDLPDYIKSMEAYKQGDYIKALEDAFLGFDATITQPETIELLKTLKGKSEDDVSTDSDDINDEEDINSLYKEASLPLKTIMAKYLEKKTLHSMENEVEKSGSSKDKSDDNKTSEAAGSSSSSKSESNECEPSVSSSNDTSAGCSKEEPVSTSNGEQSHEENDVPMPEKPTTQDKSIPDSSIDSCAKASNSSEVSEDSKPAAAKVEHCNGDSSDSKVDDSKEGVSSSSQENGKSPSPSKKGKALAKTTGVTSSSNNKSTKPRRDAAAIAAAFYNNSLTSSDCDDDEDSDSADETFHTNEESDTDTERAVNGDGSSEDGNSEDEDDEEEEEEEDEDEENNIFSASIKNEPGSDSGCTAVVALLRDDKLYVANAGDSRCIVCRDGHAVDMSIDHKPEDEPELTRIQKAGGKVTSDGRVNDGLNLSRAIGDHGYKQNKALGPKEQMITAFPDVKTLTIDPAKDEFMVLACDGIWNSMTSEAVVQFVKTRLDNGVEKLTQICEEMFDFCLAPSTIGDGTGCDNMTAIIIKFNQNNKRVRDSEEEEKSNNTKRAKPTDEESPR